MVDAVLIDNDVLIKASAFRIAAELRSCFGDRRCVPTVVGVVRFAVPSQIKRSRQVLDKEAALSEFRAILSTIHVVEPTAAELTLAALFEEEALQLGVELDRGESQLLAILIERVERVLLTGDKRAIAAVESIALELHLAVGGRIACFEQLVRTLLGRHDPADLQTKICRERNVDTAISLCFGCATGTPNVGRILAGLTSYVGALRRSAPSVLIASDDLSAMVT